MKIMRRSRSITADDLRKKVREGKLTLYSTIQTGKSVTVYSHDLGHHELQVVESKDK